MNVQNRLYRVGSAIAIAAMLMAMAPIGSPAQIIGNDSPLSSPDLNAPGLLISEIVVTPTGGEFVEIYNPTSDSIDLTNVYLTDATFAGGGTYYYNIVTGSNAGGGEYSDFNARFPDGGSIAAGEYQTVALAGSAAFLSNYGVAPTYELFDDGSNDGEAKMLEATSGSINGQGGLTDSGEVVILYYWDGATDLVTDLDYALWGDKAEAVDKTGVSIDGPDADSDPSSYQPDTAIADQDVIAAGAHASGDSWQRLDLSEGSETHVNGNGVGGDDETSENLNETWCESTPTPGQAESCSAPPPPPPPSPTVFINEIHYDNSGSDTGEAVEIAGPAGTDLTNWTVALYNGSSSQRNVYGTIPLEGTIPDQTGGYGTMAFPRAGIQNGSPDGLALLDDSGALLQFLCYEGTFVAASGPAEGKECTDIGVSEPSSTSVGFSLQLKGRGTTASEFSWEGPSPSSFGAVNSGQCFGDGPCGTGAAAPDLVGIGEESLLAVTVDPGVNPPSEGLVVTCDLSTIGGSPSQNFYDDGANGDSVAGDNVFSFKAIPTVDTTVSSNSFPCDISDDQSRSGSASINLDVIVPIGTVQGSVGDTADGLNFDAPLAGQTVSVQAVIYENALARTSSGGNSHTFFIQNTSATSDGDPNSSDGLYVYIGYYSTLRKEGGGLYTPTVGDEVVLQGPIQEYYGQTELSNPYVIDVVGHDVDIAAFDADPPADLQDAYRYWERREGMRGQVPDRSLVLNGRDVFSSTADAEVWVARPDSVIADRSDLYARRAFRDAHPLDDNYDPNNWDGNGYRILMGSLGIKAAANDNTEMIAPSRTFDTLSGTAVGGVYFDFGKYSIQPDQQVDFQDGVDPSLNAPPQAFDRAQDYSIVDFNMENLYDYRDNPDSGCDFTGDTGCPKVYPFLAAVSSPFDYIPASDAAYQARLNDIASQIINNLHAPDIIMAQEIENQDICSVSGGALDCGTSDNADGKPDVLQELALKIAAEYGPVYDAAFDPDSSDLRGIVPAFLYRTDRVELLPAAGDPILGMSPAIPGYTAVPNNGQESNPKTLNAELPAGVDACETSWVFPRAPDIGLFRIYRTVVGEGQYTDVYVIDNHFKSGPDICVAHRTEQANYNAAIVAFLQDAKPNARIVVGGDLNVYPRPDDPFAPIGQSGSSDQLGAFYNQGLVNLWDVLLANSPASAYSYVYQGQAQTLDQLFVTPNVLGDLGDIYSAHVNSDFPADYPDDGARGTSDHDPQLAVLGFPGDPFDHLNALLGYYAEIGQITGKNTLKALQDHLDKAARFQASGKDAAYQAQLQAFANQVQGKAPQFVTQTAADALASEAMELANQ